ncbi:hypothetical protein BC834DRAFT_1037220 [Gloeopeniophorella convolvens]|nr:hypothetical protein BC834DRAFT_1037220 [Gloeopeniophorella convolvens]
MGCPVLSTYLGSLGWSYASNQHMQALWIQRPLVQTTAQGSLGMSRGVGSCAAESHSRLAAVHITSTVLQLPGPVPWGKIFPADLMLPTRATCSVYETI